MSVRGILWHIIQLENCGRQLTEEETIELDNLYRDLSRQQDYEQHERELHKRGRQKYRREE